MKLPASGYFEHVRRIYSAPSESWNFPTRCKRSAECIHENGTFCPRLEVPPAFRAIGNESKRRPRRCCRADSAVELSFSDPTECCIYIFSCEAAGNHKFLSVPAGSTGRARSDWPNGKMRKHGQGRMWDGWRVLSRDLHKSLFQAERFITSMYPRETEHVSFPSPALLSRTATLLYIISEPLTCNPSRTTFRRDQSSTFGTLNLERTILLLEQQETSIQFLT